MRNPPTLILSSPHSRSSISRSISIRIRALQLPDTVAILVDPITKHGRNGKVGIVGMSLGGYVSIFFAAKHPELVDDMGLFANGCGRPFPASGSFMCWTTWFVMFAVVWLTTHLPKVFRKGVTRRMGLEI
jgi:pimeloyl-ACP methyl ester carboxylesterase